MIVKPLLGGALAFVLVSARPVDVPQQHYPLVHKVQCFAGSGTAFRVGENRFLSVDHVTSLLGCRIGGIPIQATPEPGDFSVIDYPVRKIGALKINCEGFKKGEYYFAIGHAGGEDTQTTLRLIATGEYAGNGMAVLWGFPTVIPGMSGGPVLNVDGEVVGTVNMYSRLFPVSLSTELKGTSVCRDAVQ